MLTCAPMRPYFSLLIVVALATPAFAQPTASPPAPAGDPNAPPAAGSGSGDNWVAAPPPNAPPVATTPTTPPSSAVPTDGTAKPNAQAAVPPELPPGPPQSLPEAAIPHGDGFRFGSSGRIIVGTDLRGGKPENINIVAAGPRTIEDDYLELDFSYGFETKTGVKIRPVVTLAFDGTLFHETGIFDATPALRNMFLDAQVNEHVNLWAGSRMYRGDDIYLFDYWPLDDQNTVGGGAIYHQALTPGPHPDSVEFAVHGGANRLDQPYQYQTIEVTDPEQGARSPSSSSTASA